MLEKTKSDQKEVGDKTQVQQVLAYIKAFLNCFEQE